MQITYELALELKKAGFPQKYGVGNQMSYVDENNTFGNLDSEEQCYVPLLEELIDACGEEFIGLFTRSYGGKVYKWGAQSWEGEGTTSLGKTPLEAVAKLYIALNKK